MAKMKQTAQEILLFNLKTITEEFVIAVFVQVWNG
jgi:hypothetical protein